MIINLILIIIYICVAHIVGKEMVREGYAGSPMFVYIAGGIFFPITAMLLTISTLKDSELLKKVKK